MAPPRPELRRVLPRGYAGITQATAPRPVRPGRLVGAGRVVRRDGETAFLEATLSDPEGAAVATATATARVIPLDHARGAA